MIFVVCVRSGTKYGPEYVYRLRAMVARHLDEPHEFFCITDDTSALPGVTCLDGSDTGLTSWWLKMALFASAWRRGHSVVYLDLDMVVVGDLSPLVQVAQRRPFAVCANFTKVINSAWDCRYGSCCMTFGPSYGEHVWNNFSKDPGGFIRLAGRYGDQKTIEVLEPDAVLLQEVLPTGFFLHYRDLSPVQPPRCAVVVFAGRSKPDNTNIEWVREAWTTL